MRPQTGSVSRIALVVVISAWSAAAHAQGAPSGFELALHGSPDVLEGRPAQFRGVAYRVLGLARLEPLPAATVRARYASDVADSGPWQEVRADKSGFFAIAIPMPKEPAGTPHLEVEVGDGKADRRFQFPLRFSAPWLLDLVADRRLYQPGETVHAWARLRDARTLRPLAGQEITLTVTGTPVAGRTLRTNAAGVVSLSAVIPKQAEESYCELVAAIGEREERTGFRIGTRTYERLLVKVAVTPETAKPHQPITVEVDVTTASGAPVRNAAVEIQLDTEKAHGTTDGHGVARIAMHAPAYLTHPTGSESITATVSHPAHGSVTGRALLQLAVPLTMQVDAVAPHAGLVPELDGVLYLHLSEGGGEPAPEKTPVTVTGAAIRGGEQRGETDRHGIVTVPVRLPEGAAIGQGNQATTSVVVRIGGAAPRTAAVSVPVLRDTEVVPTVSRPVVAPGEPITITLDRRASAARSPVVVELLSRSGLIEAHRVAAGTKQLRLRAPMDRLGVIEVRARPVHQREVEEGTGGFDAFIVRPARPSFPVLTADRPLYSIRTTAHLTIATTPGAPQSWAAVAVRDLAAHAGERDIFAQKFLSRAFDRAVLDPDTKAAETFLRTALAAHVSEDVAPVRAPQLVDELGQPGPDGYGLGESAEREVLRDPYPLGDELSRRGIGPVMTQLEALLASALAEGRLSEITTGTGVRRDFAPSALTELDDVPKTLGDGELTLAALHAADRSFTYDNVARRVARVRLIGLLVALAAYLDPGDDATPQQRAAAREPYQRWLPRMVERGLIDATQLADPWGGSFVLRRTTRSSLVPAVEAAGLELVSPGPDGKLGTADDVRDPFARAVPTGTPYAIASGEDELMEQLARLAPGEEVLRRLQEAYRRVTAEVAEEIAGDAVRASFSEGIAGEGFGAAGIGSGYGTGSGRGGLAGRSAKAPSVRMGSASASGRGVSSFARVIREKFPPTLLFVPTVDIDPSGKTQLDIPLSDAVTTYQVEVVVWSSDGWTWSESTRIRVDKEIVIDAPVPGYATVGDRLDLPVRVGNRTGKDRELVVALFGPDSTDRPLAERTGVKVPANDSVAVPIELPLAQALDGKVTVGVRAIDGTPLDAVRRPLVVYRPTRRVRRSVDVLTSGAGHLELEVPPRATAREGSTLLLRVGANLFEIPPGGEWSDWVDAWLGPVEVGPNTMSDLGQSTATRARGIAAAWRAPEVDESTLADALVAMTRDLDALTDADGAIALRTRAEILLALAPASRKIDARGQSLADDLVAALRSLRKAIESNIAEAGDDSHVLALAAAALALTRPAGGDLARVRELVRRARRAELQVGDFTWIATRDNSHATSALVALAEIELGQRADAIALLRTLARLEIDHRPVDPWSHALARVAAARTGSERPGQSLKLEIDGQTHTAEPSGGLLQLPAPALGKPGRHRVAIVTGAGETTLYYLQATAEYGLPWDVVPDRPGSLAVTIEGESKGLDQRAELELVVRNGSPRTIAAPMVELALPAGTELDEEGRAAIRRHVVGEPDATRGTLRLRLAGLPPGAMRRIPLPFRWSIGGDLIGLGIAAYPDDRPDDLTVSAPRTLHIEEVRP